MKKYLFVFIFIFPIFFFNQIYSQRPQFSGGNFSGTVSGTIIDGETNTPLEYVSVALLKRKDSTVVNGVLTDNKGSFSIETSTPGMFVLKYSFVGYKSGFVDSVLIIPRKPIVNLGNVILKTTSQNIEAVVVRGNAPIVEYKIDKKIVDVSSNIVAAGGTVVDALQNTPSIQTDVQGNVTLRGNSNFTVLIDGKPSPLTGTEALQQIPANLVQNVEIITNPSAKYDAEGTAGIINVVMKKQEVRGMNGIINITGGTGDDFNSLDKRGANVNFNYKYSKYNFTFGADYTDMKFALTSSSHNTYIPTLKDSLLSRNSSGNGSFHRKGEGLKFGVDYNISKNSTISFLGNVGSRNMQRPSTLNTADLYQKSDSNYISNSKNEAIRAYYNLNLNYQLKLDDKGQQLSASAYFNAGPDNVPSTTSVNSDSIHIAQNSNEAEFRGNIDYALPLGEKGKLETGYQGRFYQNNGSVSTSSNDVRFISPTQQLKAKDQIEAVYVSFSNSSFVDYQFGLRAEYEIRDIKFGKDTAMHKLFWSPSVHLSKQLPWDLQLQASYTRRIDRPREWNLNPVSRYTSLTSKQTGNPGLQPDVANTAELNLQKKINDASFISIESFYKRTDNLIYPLPIRGNNLDSLTFKNIDHDQSIGAEFMVNLAPARWINFNISTSIYNYHIFGIPNTNSGIQTSANTWNVKISPTFRMPWGMGIQITYTYNAPSINASGGKQSDFYSSGFGIRQELLKHKANLTLQAQNPVGFTRTTSTTYSNFQSVSWFQRESKVYMLTFSYRFNNYKAQPNKKPQEDTSNGDDYGVGM